MCRHSNVMTLLLLFICTLLISSLCAFEIRWIPVELDEEEARKEAGEDGETKDESNPAVERRSGQWKSNSGYSLLIEDNRVCTKFLCDKKPCCTGECVYVFGVQLCLLLPRPAARR
ncbi:hypothetical protein NP493_1175g01028 [Ridgeia piscesae]|uniref:Uncharacterized protein n=1 Tax=Ridgeia piscesae TaxID=27915 RepID=A0AAD9KDT6_RIDPI|nr:hypothetical protein NP493_1175g01028 [Ridgeia piscesae]